MLMLHLLREDTSGQKVMFLGRAETGTFTVGRKGINVPPPVDPSNPGILYHRLVDNKDNQLYLSCLVQIGLILSTASHLQINLK